MSKHTPGPWDFSWQIQPNGCPTVGYKGLMVCMVAHSAKDPSQKEEALANANLIAAAPDLLAALEAFERIKDIWLPAEAEEQHAEEMYALHMARNNMIAAIARATGEQP